MLNITGMAFFSTDGENFMPIGEITEFESTTSEDDCSPTDYLITSINELTTTITCTSECIKKFMFVCYCGMCPNKKVVYLAKHGRYRTRKKNYNRMVKIVIQLTKERKRNKC